PSAPARAAPGSCARSRRPPRRGHPSCRRRRRRRAAAGASALLLRRTGGRLGRDVGSLGVVDAALGGCRWRSGRHRRLVGGRRLTRRALLALATAVLAPALRGDAVRVGQQRHLTRVLDRPRDLALLLRVVARDAPG